MRVLITGAAGFAGPHLVKELATHGHESIVTDLARPTPLPGAAVTEALDVCNRSALTDLLRRTQPDACIHMAGITSVAEGVTDPDRMLCVNVRGTTTLIDALRTHAATTRLLVISTAHVYGVGQKDTSFAEATPMRPLSMYAISKAAADLATLAVGQTADLHTMVARPNNHTGPGQSRRFVVAAFAQQVADIRAGRTAPRMKVGNLDSARDFMDVRDVVRAYRLLLETGTSGHAYNIGSKNRTRIGTMLDTLCRLGGIDPERRVDPELFRPTDWSPQLDTHRLEAATGWQPAIPFEQTLKDMLDDISNRKAS